MRNGEIIQYNLRSLSKISESWPDDLSSIINGGEDGRYQISIFELLSKHHQLLSIEVFDRLNSDVVFLCSLCLRHLCLKIIESPILNRN